MEQPEQHPTIPPKASRQLSQSTMKRREKTKNAKTRKIVCMKGHRLEQAGQVLNIVCLVFFSVYTFSETTFKFWTNVSNATSAEAAIPVLALLGFTSILGACLHNVFFVKRQWHTAIYITVRSRICVRLGEIW